MFPPRERNDRASVRLALVLDITCTFLTEFVFIPALLLGIIDFYYFIPLSLTLTLFGGVGEGWGWGRGSHKVSTEQNLLLSFSLSFLTVQDEI